MKRCLQFAVCLLLCLFTVISVFPAIPTAEAADYVYSDGYTLIGDVSIPFPEYMPGSFFTKNGMACTCHYDPSIDCVANGDRCNCLRYVTVDGVRVDLMSVQCIGFARYCFYRLFGFLDNIYNTDKYYSAGSLKYGQVTASSVRQLFSALKPGAHIRFKLQNSEHSVILLSKSDEGFTVYQCNSSGNGIGSASCVVSTKTYTWASFASYAFRGVLYANMPYSYPERLEYSDGAFVVDSYEPGMYVTTDNLRLREKPGTDSGWLDTLPIGTEIYVPYIDNGWGRVVYGGRMGYISLAYTARKGGGAPLVPAAEGVTVKNGYVTGLPAGLGSAELAALFEGGSAAADLAEGETVKTGTLINAEAADGTVCTYTAVVTGDINGDGYVTADDCDALRSLLNGDETPEEHFRLAADIDGDGMAGTTDYKKLKLLLENAG